MTNAFVFDSPTSAPRKIKGHGDLTALVDLKIDGELVSIFANTSAFPNTDSLLFASYLVRYPVVIKTTKAHPDELGFCIALRSAAPKEMEIERLIDDSVSEHSPPPDDDTSEQSVNELSSASSESHDSLSEASTNVEDDVSEFSD